MNTRVAPTRQRPFGLLDFAVEFHDTHKDYPTSVR